MQKIKILKKLPLKLCISGAVCRGYFMALSVSDEIFSLNLPSNKKNYFIY